MWADIIYAHNKLFNEETILGVFKLFAAGAFSTLIVAPPGYAADASKFPAKSIRMVVPFAPGGNIDITARTVSAAMSEILGQNILVDNRAGAGGTIGSEIVAKSPADGYTVLMGSNSVYGVAPNLYKNVYNPARDFAGVSILTSVPFVLVVHPSVPAKNVKELVAVANTKKGLLTLAYPGIGSTNHLVGELFQIAIGVRMTGVPYKGSGPALVDLIAGRVDALMDQLTSSIEYIQSGRIRPIAVTTNQRSQALPKVATMAESGLKGFDVTTSTGILVPAGTPRAAIDRLNPGLTSTKKSLLKSVSWRMSVF